MNPTLHERLGGVVEVLIGTFAASTPIFERLFADVMTGARVITVLGGAFIAIHGTLRIIRPRRRRGTDRTLSLSEES